MRAWRTAHFSLLAIALVGVAAGFSGTTAAVFNATVGNVGSFSTMALLKPAAGVGATFALSPSGNSAIATWSNYTAVRPTSPDPGVTGFGVLRAASVNGTDCVGVSFPTAAIGTVAAAATTFTDTTAATTFATGTLVCYQLATAWQAPGQPAPTWFSGNSASQTNPTASTRVGFYATTLDFTDGVGGTPCAAGCTLESGDTIQIAFNQVTNQAVLSGDICLDPTTNTIYIGAGAFLGTCDGTFAVAKLTGGIVTSAAAVDWTGVGYDWNGGGACTLPGAAGSALCISMQQAAVGEPVSISGTWKLTMAAGSAIQSAVGAVVVCSALPACQPLATGNHLP